MGLCREIFDPYFFAQRIWASYEQAKIVSRTFSFSWRYSIKNFEIRETVWACSYGAHVEFVFLIKKDRKSVTLSLLEYF